jgi:hypothetical protein
MRFSDWGFRIAALEIRNPHSAIRNRSRKVWLRGRDLNPRPLGYEPNELPDCSTPRQADFGLKILDCRIQIHQPKAPVQVRMIVEANNKSAIRNLKSEILLVGLGRVELPTSRLSGVRSNQLSYRPILLAKPAKPRPKI